MAELNAANIKHLMTMTKECIICGTPVNVPGNPEIVACNNDICQITVENSIGLHYQTGNNNLSVPPDIILTKTRRIINTHF